VRIARLAIFSPCPGSPRALSGLDVACAELDAPLGDAGAPLAVGRASVGGAMSVA